MLLIVWMLFVLVVSIVPVSGPQTDLPSDKIAHFIVYGLTAVLMARYFAGKLPWKKAVYTAVVSAALYGGFIEVLQYFMPPRSFSFGDMAANAAGALVFAAVYAGLRRK